LICSFYPETKRRGGAHAKESEVVDEESKEGKHGKEVKGRKESKEDKVGVCGPLERKDDKNYWSIHWIIMRQMKRMRHPLWKKAYPCQFARQQAMSKDRPLWEQYFEKYAPTDRAHAHARIAFARTPGSHSIVCD
jgi:hypothetical protein